MGSHLQWAQWDNYTYLIGPFCRGSTSIRLGIKMILRDNYKKYRGISGTTDDGRIDMLIPAISQIVKTYCGRTFKDYYSTNKEERFSFTWGQPSVFLTEIPIVTVVSVLELKEGSQTDYTTLTSGTDYIVDTTYDAIYRIESGRTKNWNLGIDAVKVTYRGGYATLPDDLELACFDLVTYYLKEQYIPEKNHSSFTIRLNTEKADFPPHIKRILDMYRDV